MNENRCVCCGAVIPEGTMVCRICSGDIRKRIEETRPGETICISYDQCQQLLAQMPEPMANRVITCRVCKYRFTGEIYANCCEKQMEKTGWIVEIPVILDWFCADGERKEGR